MDDVNLEIVAHAGAGVGAGAMSVETQESRCCREARTFLGGLYERPQGGKRKRQGRLLILDRAGQDRT